jgi:hypothetical protein
MRMGFDIPWVGGQKSTRLSTSRTQSLDELTTSTTPNQFYKLMYNCNIIMLLISVLTYLTKLYIIIYLLINLISEHKSLYQCHMVF